MDLTSLVPLIISIATPFVVQLVTSLVVKYLPFFSGLGIVAIVVPIVGALVTWVTNLATTAGPVWYVQIGVGLLAVFLNELYKEIKAGISSGVVTKSVH